MRHPPRSVLLAVAGAVALLTSAMLPVVTAEGATPARTVEYSVTGQWDAGFQGAVSITHHAASLSGWSLTFDLADGQRVTQGWNATWSQSGATVTATNESWTGPLGTGTGVHAGFLAAKTGGDAVPTAFKLNDTTCNADTEPTPAATRRTPVARHPRCVSPVTNSWTPTESPLVCPVSTGPAASSCASRPGWDLPTASRRTA